MFPRRTKATPVDDAAFIGDPPLWLADDQVRTVHVSCTFTWDKPEAERLVGAWRFRFPRADVLLGGPAYGDPGREFVPGMYLREGYTITSRGCPNRCERCLVPTREGGLRLLPIRDGWDVLDNNLLAALDLPNGKEHLAEVFAMLRRQPRRARFTGGLEARRLTWELANEILGVGPDRIFLAYDSDGVWEEVRRAVGLIRHLSGWSKGSLRHHVSCYVLVGFPGDTVRRAERRIQKVIAMSVRAYPMFYRDEHYSRLPPEWHDLVGGVLAMGGAR
ncbi:MAG TPA: hypothetical protein PK082_05035 [Phycisphaerae bacterium]|nr:hypothetical protein [Phycisphaerae bacterium]